MFHPPRAILRAPGLRALLAGALVLGLGACSALLDLDAAQCRSDRDCARFRNATCDLARRICVAGAPPDGSGAGGAPGGDGGAPADGSGGTVFPPFCRGPQGCSPCAAPMAGLLNACSNVTCVPFDNRTRLHNLTPDGGIKPLP